MWFVGSLIVDRGKDLSAVAQSSESRLNEVAKVLREYTKNVEGGTTPVETAWVRQVNGVCARQSSALKKLGTPTDEAEIAAYLRRSLPTVRRHHRQLESMPPPDALAMQASKAGRALVKQEAILVDVRAAAGRGHTAATLDHIERLRSLARTANPTLVELGLTSCALPSSGLPLF